MMTRISSRKSLGYGLGELALSVGALRMATGLAHVCGEAGIQAPVAWWPLVLGTPLISLRTCQS